MPYVYLPRVYGGKKKPSPTPPKPPACVLSDTEQALLNLMVAHPEQRRGEIVCHPLLLQVARARATDMGRRNYFGHTDPDGDGPNRKVTSAGYALPGWYPAERDANSIESIGGGRASAASQWQGWLDSPGHRTHVLGLIDFYAQQTQIGIGHVVVPGSNFGNYWVLLTAPREGA